MEKRCARFPETAQPDDAPAASRYTEEVRAWLNAKPKRAIAAIPRFEYYRSELFEQGEHRP